MVGIAVEPYTACSCAFGGTLVFTFRLKQIRTDMNLVLEELECAVVLRTLHAKHVGRHDNLVEEVPPTIVEQSAASLLNENVVERIVHVVLIHLFDVRLARQALGHRLVGRVVVHIAHHHHLAVLVGTHKRVFQHTHLTCRNLTIGRRRETARPVAHDYRDMLSCHCSAHSEIATGVEG